MEIHEKALLMSLHIGVARIAQRDRSMVRDIIHDTTDSSRNMSIFVTVIYKKAIFDYLVGSDPTDRIKAGLSETLVLAFE